MRTNIITIGLLVLAFCACPVATQAAGDPPVFGPAVKVEGMSATRKSPA